MNDRPTGQSAAQVVAVLGPTNTGKTHLAVERMLGHASGMIGLPLRLLAREVYERVVRQRGAASVALITGEEKIVPERPRYFVCTVEAMPMDRAVDFVAVDEIQLVADPERGHLFTHRLLHARGRFETMFLGAGTMAPLIRRLVPEAEIRDRERLSQLSYAEPAKLTRLPRRSAVVAFSAEQVYAIAELLRRQRGGAAVVMGALSPRTRNAQVALFQSGEVDFLVATDAIGMGLNMDVDHVAFAGLKKFDGRRTRHLHAHEIGQIAGRAGRHLRDGTFGVTAQAQDLDPDLVEQVVEHRFDPVRAAEWRNGRLDFDSLGALIRSLETRPDWPGLVLSAPALDEVLLRRAAREDDVQRIARSRGSLMRLWDCCQMPDFPKTTPEEHFQLVMHLFEALTGPGGRVTEDWFAGRFAGLDSDEGQIDRISARLAGVRTLSYIANRPGWLEASAHWRERTRALEDRLSDVLHERLTARFVDRRTTVLMQALKDYGEADTQVSDDGEVSVEGQAVGRLTGISFKAEAGASALETRALGRAARQAVAPEIERRLGRLAAEPDEAFGVTPEGAVLWRGVWAGQIDPGGDWFAPRVRLLGELGSAPARERAQRRLEAWLAGETGRALKPLKRLKTAIESGALKGLPRGLAFRLLEAGGVIDRAEVERDLAALSQAERRTLRTFGVRMGAHSVWLPALLKPRPREVAQAFTGGWAFWRRSEGVTLLPSPAPPPRRLSAFGLRAVGRYVAPVELLEAMAERRAAGKGTLSEEDLQALGMTIGEATALIAALKTTRARQPDRPGKTPKPVKDSPFAVLRALAAPLDPAARTKRRRPRRARSSTGGT
jgi:ATP-dependent RNA helicase SUPV3L1/SUV3